MSFSLIPSLKVNSCRPIDKLLDREVFRSIDRYWVLSDEVCSCFSFDWFLWIYRYAIFTVRLLQPQYVILHFLVSLFFVKHLDIRSMTLFLINWNKTFIHKNILHLTKKYGKTSFKENITTTALLRNDGVNKTKVITYYLDNDLLFCSMHLWILRNCNLGTLITWMIFQRRIHFKTILFCRAMEKNFKCVM